MKTNLNNWLCGLCAILRIAVLVLQNKQLGRLDSSQNQQDTIEKLAGQVAAFDKNLESRFLQSEQKNKELTAEIANTIQQQTSVMNRALPSAESMWNSTHRRFSLVRPSRIFMQKLAARV